MYCSSCGSAVAQNLNYCNRCGAKVSDAKIGGVNKTAMSFHISLINAIAAVFIVGLGAIAVLIGVMKQVVGFDTSIILAITLISFAMMLTVESVLIRLLLKGKKGTEEADDLAKRQNEQTTRELEEAQARVLPEPMPSVTEHTTRTLEPVYSERKSE
jgi:hypothetical protein